MQTKVVEMLLPEGVFKTKVTFFTSADDQILWDIYVHWRLLTSELSVIESRGVNLPEGLSEGAFCRAMDVVRITQNIAGANTSYDAYDLKRKKRIQVKGCSVMPDLTSFGPRSEWDELYFLDFYRKGEWDGTFDIYLIPNDLVYNHKVNANHTLRDQQKLNRRPRLSIYKEIIVPNKIKPIKTHKI